MKHYLLLMALLWSSSALASFSKCEAYLKKGDIPTLTRCLGYLCQSAETEQQLQTCLAANKIAVGTENYQLATQKLIEYTSTPRPCNSNSECSNGDGCYPSDFENLLTDEQSDYVAMIGVFLGLPTVKKSNRQACENHYECQSGYCANASTQATTKKCLSVGFCRKAKLAEYAPSPVLCEDGLFKDQLHKCYPKAYFQDRAPEITSLILNRNKINVCNPKDPKLKDFYDKLEQFNMHERAFELVFADSNTNDQLHMQDQLRDLAQEIRKKRLEAIKKLNKANEDFKKDYETLATANHKSEKIVTFKGKEYKENELYEEKIKNNLVIELMKDLETIRAEYNTELAEIYSYAYKQFLPLYVDFMNIDEDEKDFKFGSQGVHHNFWRMFLSKNKKKWRYRARLKGDHYKYLKETNDGLSVAILEQIYPGGSEALIPKSSSSKRYFYSFPFNTNSKGVVLNKRKKFYELDRFSDLFSFLVKDTMKISSEKGFFPVFYKFYTDHTKEYLDKFPGGSWDSLIDPELIVYQGCWKGEVTEDKKQQYCGNMENVLEDVKSYALAHLIAYSGNGDKKKLEGFFGGNLVEGQSNDPNYKSYRPLGSRGYYFRHIYETFYNLEAGYRDLANTKDVKLACLDKSKESGSASPVYYSVNSALNPRGFVSQEKAASGGTYGVARSAGDGLDESLSNNSSYNRNTYSSRKDKGLSGSSPGSYSTSGNGTNGLANSSSNSGTSKIKSANAVTNSSFTESYRKEYDSSQGYGPERGNDFSDTNFFPSVRQGSNRSISGLSNEETSHVMSNLEKYEAPVSSLDTVFQRISETYVNQAYPIIFSD